MTLGFTEATLPQKNQEKKMRFTERLRFFSLLVRLILNLNL